VAKELLNLLGPDQTSQNLKTSLETFIGIKEYIPPKIKTVLVQSKAVSAHEFYDITKQLQDGPVSTWTTQQLDATIPRVREVSCFYMRGTTEEKKALEEFHTQWLLW